MPEVPQNNLPDPFPPAKERSTGAELAAVVASLAWIGVAAIYFVYKPVEGGTLGLVMTGLIVLLPIALLWVAVSMSRSVRSLRDEAARLQAELDRRLAASGPVVLRSAYAHVASVEESAITEVLRIHT